MQALVFGPGLNLDGRWWELRADSSLDYGNGDQRFAQPRGEAEASVSPASAEIPTWDSIVIWLFGPSLCLEFLEDIRRCAAEAKTALFDRVISGNLEQSGIRFAADDVGQPVGGLTDPRIAVFAHHDGLQFRRI